MNIKKTLIILSALCSLLLLGPARAATVEYVLDQSNKSNDPAENEYLLVSISDDTPGQLDFHVETLPLLADQAGRNYGIKSFGFNFSELFPLDVSDLAQDDFLLPDRWKMRPLSLIHI